MTKHKQAIAVGAPDPEMKTSPILEDTDEEYEFSAQEYENLPQCYFNNVSYPAGQFVCSGSGELLHCEDGLWIREGSCVPGKS